MYILVAVKCATWVSHSIDDGLLSMQAKVSIGCGYKFKGLLSKTVPQTI